MNVKVSKYFFPYLLILFLLNVKSYKGVTFKKFDTNLGASISSSKDNVCVGEKLEVIFTASDGNAPYTFIYSINDESELSITSNGNSNTASVNVNTSKSNNFTYKLIRVEDSSKTKTQINKDISITVNAPPSVDFSFNNDNSCSGTNISFTSTINGNPPYTYSWDFGDGNTSTLANPIHQFEALGCDSTNFDVKLIVVDKNGCTSSEVTKTIRVIEKPNISLFDTSFGDFDNCNSASPSNPSYTVEVNNSSVDNCVTSLIINWGDGSTTSNPTFPLSHTYSSIGLFKLEFTGVGSNGCSNTISYDVKNVNNPAGGFESPGNTSNLCAPTAALGFGISNWGLNSSDTNYTVNFGDGSTQRYSQSDLENSIYFNASDPANSATFPTPHSYTSGSCNVSGNEYIATLTVANACASTEFTISNISVLDSSIPDFTVDSSNCVNKAIKFQNNSTLGNNPGCSSTGSFTWDFGDGTIVNRNNVSSASDESHTYSLPGNYDVKLTISSFCGSETITKQVCVEPETASNFSVSDTEGCIPFNITTTNETVETSLCSSPRYLWTINYTAENCGTSENFSFVNGTDENSKNPEIIFNEPGNYELVLNTITSCGTVTASENIRVTKPPEVTIEPIADFCGNTSISPIANIENCTANTGGITYNWTFTGGNPSTSNTLNPGNIVYNAPGVYEVTLEVTSECGTSNKAIQTFEVFEKPAITNTDTTQEICSGQSTKEIVFNQNFNSFTWTAVSSGRLTGFTSSGNTNTIPSQNIINTGSTIETLTYTVTPSSGICEGDSVDFVITVNPSPIFTTQPSSSEVCINGSATVLEVDYENGIETPQYQWFSNNTNTNNGGNLITGATFKSYNPPTDTVGEIFYYAEITFSSGGCDKITSNTASVNVIEQLTITSTALPQTICVGGIVNPLEVSFTGGSGTTNYQWYSNTTNSNTGGNLITGATNSTYTPPAFSTAGNFYYYVELSADGNGCTTTSSEVFEVTVISKPIIDSQSFVSQELCQNATPNDLMITVSGGSSSTKDYQWYVNTVNSTTGGNPINGANSENYTPLTNQVGTFYYYVVVMQPESNCSVVSDIYTLIINEAPIFTTQPSSSEVCINGNTNPLEVNYTNGTGTPSYQWFSNTVNSNEGGTVIDGETTSIYNPPTNTVGEIFYYVEISFSSGGCSKITSDVASINVVNQLVINPISDTKSVCIGGTINELEVTFTGGTGTPSYQWFSNTINSNTGGNLINGATNNSYTPPPFLVDGTFYYYAEVSLNGNGCTNATSNVFQINVVSKPTIATQPIASQELCQGAIPANLSVTASGGSTSAKFYQWYVNTTNSNSGGNPVNGANDSTFTPSTNTIGTFYYYVVVSQPESGCNIVSNTSTLKINEAPVFSKQPISSEVCLDENANLLEVDYENGTGIATYQWFFNTTNSSINGTVINGATNASYNPPTNVVGEIFYYAEIYFSSGGCDKIVSDVASVVVNQIPVISNAEITIYSESTFSFNPASVIGNVVPNDTKYTWSAPTFKPENSILGASAGAIPQDVISQTLENTDTLPVEVTYTIIPETTKCTGNTFTLKVIVNPNINSNTMVSNISCFNSNDGEISTNIEGGIPFSLGAPYLTSWSGPNGFSSKDASITNLEAGLYVLRIEDSTGFFITEEYTVTQPDALLITKDIEQNISCFQGNDGLIEITISGGTAPFSYNWTTTDGSGIVAGIKNQSILTAGTYSLEVVDGNNCTITETFVLTEPDGLNITSIFKQDILCFGENTGSINLDISGGTPIEISPGIFGYNYKWTGPNGYSSNEKNINNLISGDYVLDVTDALGCTFQTSITLEQSSEIKIDVTKKDLTCNGANDGSIDVMISGGVLPYQISWSNFANGTSLNNLSAGIYTITVIDGNNCEKKIPIEVEEPLFSISPEINDISCYGSRDGSIKLNLEGGILPISVLWDDDASAGVERNNLSAGTYTVSIVDSDVNQCPISRSFTITEPPEIIINEVLTDAIDCNTVSSGSIELEVFGGRAPYRFSWSNGSTDKDLFDLSPGTYSVSITDANGCIAEKIYTIFRQEPLSISLLEDTTINCALKETIKEITASVSGGFPPYTYEWSSGEVSGTNGEKITVKQDGSYTINIVDNRGCTKSEIFNINLPKIGTADFIANSFALQQYNVFSIKDPIQFTNNADGDFLSITWNFGDGSDNVMEENPNHTYDRVGTFLVTQQVTYENNCIDIFEREITVDIGYSLIIPNAFTPNNDGINDTIRPNFSGMVEVEMTILDSWGAIIFNEKGDSLKGWNGLLKTKPAENGNYIMMVRAVTFYATEITETKPIILLK